MRRNNRNAAVLVADSGSTKTDWMLLGETGRKSFQTQGLNPVLMPEEQIVGILQCELLPELPNEDCFEVFFYGAGVRPEFVGKMEQAFQQAFAAGSPFAAITPHSTLHTPRSIRPPRCRPRPLRPRGRHRLHPRNGQQFLSFRR